MLTLNPGRRARVLVVENSEPLRNMLERIIADHGYAADGASSVEEALTLQRKTSEPYIAVLMDLTLPDMEGPEVIVALRQAGLTAPVIVMSGSENSSILARTQDYAQLLPKPLNPDAITRALRTVVKRHRRRSIGSNA